MKKIPMKLKIPDKRAIVHKGESLFHGSYLTVETVMGHGPLQWLAAGMLLCILVDLIFHWFLD